MDRRGGELKTEVAALKVDGTFAWAFVAALSCASSGPIAKEREKDVRSGAPEPAPVFHFDLDVRGEKIGLVGGGMGPLCAGEVQGVVVVDRPRGGPERIPVKVPRVPERVCRGCTPLPDRPDSCDNACEERFPDWLELTSYPFAPGGYILEPEGMVLTCARDMTRFAGVSVFVGEHGEAQAVSREELQMLLARVPIRPVEPPPPPVPVEEPRWGPEPTSKFLEVHLRELGSERPISSVRITLEEIQDCPPNRGKHECRPQRPRRFTARTNAKGEARFVLPLGTQGFVLRPFAAPGFVGTQPEVSAFKRQVRLATWESIGEGLRVTYRLVPPHALQVASAEAAITASVRNAKLAAWIAQHAAKPGKATQIGLSWYVQWDAATSVECAEIDALEGDVIPRGGQCPVDPP
jgi:hypothetical protein